MKRNVIKTFVKCLPFLLISSCLEDDDVVVSESPFGETVVSHQTSGGDYTRTTYGTNFFGDETINVSKGHQNATYKQDLVGLGLQLVMEVTPKIEESFEEARKKSGERRAAQPRISVSRDHVYPLVQSVQSGSIASRQGIKVGDYIIQYNGDGLGWANEQNNPLAFKINKARGRGGLATVHVFRKGGFFKKSGIYKTVVPAGKPLGVGLSQGKVPL